MEHPHETISTLSSPPPLTTLYSVWLFTRPLSYATIFPSFVSAFGGKQHLRHWAVLVSEMSLLDAQAIMLRRIEYRGNDRTVWGTMYELFRDDGNINNVNINRQFGMETVRKEWQMIDIQYVGQTEMTPVEIEIEGTRCVSPFGY
jgi:hypothetical protein